MNKLDKIIAFEQGELDEQGIIELFSELLKTGEAWTLQGLYGRTAMALIKAGWLDRNGKILKLPPKKSKDAITEQEQELFERVSAPNRAVVRGTYHDKKCAIVVQVFQEKDGYTMYPIAMLVTEEIIAELKIDGRKAQ